MTFAWHIFVLPEHGKLKNCLFLLDSMLKTVHGTEERIL